MDKQLLSILCCPITHKSLSLAKAPLLRELNVAIEAGQLQNRDGHTLATPLREALVSDDGKILYPVDDGIPVMLEGESILVDQFASAG